MAREVGTEGSSGGQAQVQGVAGVWKDLTDNVNCMAGNLTGQVRNIAEVTTAVANGDLSKKITVDVRGEILELKNTINTMVDQLNMLPRTKAAPLDFWWGPMSVWLALALAIIVAGGFAILRRLKLLRVALGVLGRRSPPAIGVLALAGHTMTARWHLGPISGFQLLVGARHLARGARVPLLHDHRPEDGAARRRARGSPTRVALGLLAALLIAPTTTEFAAKVALLGVARDRLPRDAAAARSSVPRRPTARRRSRLPAVRRRLGGVLVVVDGAAPSPLPAPLPPGALPPITILPVAAASQTQLDRHTAQLIAHDLVAAVPARGRRPAPRLARAGHRPGPADRRRAARRPRRTACTQTAAGTGRSPRRRSRRAVAAAPQSTALARRPR